jgi:hypothetical protein
LNYWGVYERLIRRAYLRSILGCYFETHHIIPKSFGGGDHPHNLVDLTYREHFLAHWLMSKMFCGIEKRKMAFAFYAMTLRCSKHRIVSSWQFEAVKRCLVAQHLETRKKRQEFKWQLEREKASKKFVEASLLIEKHRAGKITDADDFFKLSDLLKKHDKKVRVVKGKHYRDRIAEILIGSESPKNKGKNKHSRRTHSERLARWKEKRCLEK